MYTAGVAAQARGVLAADYQVLVFGADVRAEEYRCQPGAGCGVFGAEGDPEFADPSREGGEEDDLVAGVPVDGGPAGDVLEQLVCDAGADVFGAPVRCPGAVGTETGIAHEVGEQGERGAGLRGGAVAAFGDVGDSGAAVGGVEDGFGSGGHPGCHVAVIEV